MFRPQWGQYCRACCISFRQKGQRMEMGLVCANPATVSRGLGARLKQCGDLSGLSRNVLHVVHVEYRFCAGLCAPFRTSGKEGRRSAGKWTDN